MTNRFDAQACWAILESFGIDLEENAIQYMMEANDYYETRKRLLEAIALRGSKFKKLDDGCWLIK
jgi:hypothetical protein